MKKFAKVMAFMLCAALLVCGGIFGTLAYLTSTDSVTNTFTVGNVSITLDETKLKEDGTVDTGAARVKANEFKLIPGTTYTKDPTIHVAAGSENCWLFVKVENSIAAIEGNTKIAKQLEDNGWELVDGETNVYAYKDQGVAETDYVVFETVTIDGSVNNATLSTYSGKTIKITAYAVQAQGFANAEAAWDAAGFTL